MEFNLIVETLGGEKALGHPIKSRMDFVELGDRGLTKSSLSHLAKSLSLSMKELARLLPVTERTLQRYSAQQHLSTVVSEQALQIAQVAASGSALFEDREKFLA
ncbi:MAG: antitoxin Xre-like helix-turn-helix domain-containing protein, partial [Candidatus Neomarinimicrobiota bacterium]